jgi:hypothetical protein
MGPELLAAIIGPVAGGIISLYLWQNKKNYEFINDNFRGLKTTINVIERKIDDLRFDVAKNYVRNEDLANHARMEEQWHEEMNSQMREVRTELRDLHKTFDRKIFGDD